jgi:hypothetical protein
MINSVMTVPCNDCLGQGYIFFGNDQDYDCEPCACVGEAK